MSILSMASQFQRSHQYSLYHLLSCVGLSCLLCLWHRHTYALTCQPLKHIVLCRFIMSILFMASQYQRSDQYSLYHLLSCVGLSCLFCLWHRNTNAVINTASNWLLTCVGLSCLFCLWHRNTNAVINTASITYCLV